MIKNTITCKKCGSSIEITDAIIEQAKLDLEPKLKEQAIKESRESFELDREKFEIQLKQKDQKLGKFKEKELKFLQKETELEQEKKDMQLQVARLVSEKSKELVEVAYKKASEEHVRIEHDYKLRELEKDKTIAALKKNLDDVNKKAQNDGSQQLQGEVLEVEVEDMLRKLFPHDGIQEIAKGVNGSDIRHIVRSPLGSSCGIILWECKRTKNWTQSWINKLKADLRNEKADIPVIVSTTLPREIKTSVDILDGVYVCDFSYAKFLALTLREKIIAVARQKAISANKESKAERLYSAVTNNEFIQQLKFMFETYKQMRGQTDKERKVFDKLWKERDIQIEQLIKSTVSIYSTIAAQLGSSMPQIEDFELDLLTSGQEDKIG